MEKLDQFIGTISEQLTALAKAHGAQAVELGMFVFRIPHMQTLVVGFIFLALFIASIIILARLWKQNWENYEIGGLTDARIFGCISIAVSAICLFGTVINLGSITAWVGAFNGPAAVAIAVLNKLVK